jgi:predicted phage baseplate assembly protein
MPLPLPDLDDRRWVDLVDEARSRIPRYAPQWTDYNASDPGITLIELLAWIAEADVFGIDRIPRRHRAAFLRLAGIALRPVVPASTPVQFGTPGPARAVPAGVVLTATSEGGVSTSHRIIVTDGGADPATALDVLGCALLAVQVWTGTDYVDRTQDWRHGTTFDALGPDPAGDPTAGGSGGALLLGLDPDQLLSPTARLSLWLTLDDAATSADGPAPHHSAVTEWGYHDGTRWQPLDDGSLVDDTRALTRSGRVVLPFADLTAVRSVIGAVTTPLRWVRVRIARGRHDVAPRLSAVLADAAPAVQAVPGFATWRFAPGPDPLPVSYTEGAHVRFRLVTDSGGHIVAITDVPPVPPGQPEDPDDITALVLAVATDSVGLTLLPGGIADGAPSFASTLEGAPYTGVDATVWTAGPASTQRWQIVDNLLRSDPADRHVVFDALTGSLLFGDGEHGRIPSAGSTVIVSALRTDGVAGTPTMRSAWRIDATNPLTVAADVAPQPMPLTGLAVRAAAAIAAVAADDLETGEGRAADQVWTHERLIELAPPTTLATLDQLDRAVILSRSRPARAATALDFERLALDVPGTAVLRARAWSGLDPAYPGMSAPGTVTVVVVPGLPARRPVPTAALLTQVRRFLCPRRTIGTRLIVTGPSYVEVSVTAVARALANVDPARVRADALDRLYAYLHPITGGPAGRGWPFGRDVAQAEILRQLDLVTGLDHVDELAITVDGMTVDCGNVCVDVLSLVVSGTHEVTIR